MIKGNIIIITFCGIYNGYKEASYAQSYNVNAINEYHKNGNKGVLKLKKVPPTHYGYNVGNWNAMPAFMRQCYKLNLDTIIKYDK
jgi:hypothetical protein